MSGCTTPSVFHWRHKHPEPARSGAARAFRVRPCDALLMGPGIQAGCGKVEGGSVKWGSAA